jgi:hypothetical protein
MSIFKDIDLFKYEKIRRIYGSRRTKEFYYYCGFYAPMIENDFETFNNNMLSNNEIPKVKGYLISLLLDFYESFGIAYNEYKCEKYNISIFNYETEEMETRLEKFRNKLKEKMYKITDFVFSHNLIDRKGATNQDEIDKIIEYIIMRHTHDEIKEEYIDVDVETAVIINALNVVKYLIEEKEADINRCIILGGSPPLVFAIGNNNLEMVKYMVDHGAHINHDSKNSSYKDEIEYIYKQCNSIEIIEYLLQKNIIDNNSKIYKKYEEMIKMKTKERSDLLREELVSKYHSPENIEKWSLMLNKPFDETIDVM